MWHNLAKNRWQITALNTVQRPAMIGMLSAFRTVAAELIAIYYAIDLAIYEQQSSPNPRPQTYAIFSDSRAGVQAIANPLKVCWDKNILPR